MEPQESEGEKAYLCGKSRNLSASFRTFEGYEEWMSLKYLGSYLAS